MKLNKLIYPVTLLVSACSFSGGSVPEDHFYRLPVANAVTGQHPVQVMSVGAEGIYNERAILFSDAAQPLELHRYDYHFWVQTPALLVQHYLQSCLPPATVKDAVGVRPVIRQFERRVSPGQAEAVISLHINNRDYSARVIADGMGMHATVEAFGQAMQQICKDLADTH